MSVHPFIFLAVAGLLLPPARAEAQRIGDRAYDVIFMDCLAADFAALTPPRLQPPSADPADHASGADDDHLPEIAAALDAEDDLGA